MKAVIGMQKIRIPNPNNKYSRIFEFDFYFPYLYGKLLLGTFYKNKFYTSYRGKFHYMSKRICFDRDDKIINREA
jgi:hypothetical protein